VADAIFENRRLASIYDGLDSDRSDLDAYVALVNEFSAGSVLDIGCCTGTFARWRVAGFGSLAWTQHVHPLTSPGAWLALTGSGGLSAMQ
jgi:hypothetical protein